MKRCFIPKHVVKTTCETNAAAIAAPFFSHGGVFSLLHQRAGRTFWYMICIHSLFKCYFYKYSYLLVHVFLSHVVPLVHSIAFCACWEVYLSPVMMAPPHCCIHIPSEHMYQRHSRLQVRVDRSHQPHAFDGFSRGCCAINMCASLWRQLPTLRAKMWIGLFEPLSVYHSV